MCLTYGRTILLEEAVHSFLIQDYPGKKELIILNDLKEQTLIFNHPEVTVINLKERVKPLGEKRNLCAQACSHDILFPWDDDDIYLANRLSFSVEKLITIGGNFFKPDRAYVWNNGAIDCLFANTYHSQSCFTRDLFNSVGGYASMGSGEDQDIEKRFLEKGQQLNFKADIEDYFYIYRWGGVEFYHLSAFGEDSDDKPISGEQKVGQIIKTGILSGVIASGQIVLNPHWDTDYQVQKNKFDLQYK
jgi:glycosyltransferase involved in cell wall biosynthesis